VSDAEVSSVDAGRVDVGVARPEEYAALGEATLAGYLAIVPDMRADYLAEVTDVAARAATPGRVILAARLDGRPVGSTTVVFSGALLEERLPEDAALLRMFAVHPAAQGLGVGGALLDAAIDVARARGRNRMLLFTQPVMHPAQRLYESRGFARVPDRDWALPDGTGLLGYELTL
jgi:GNAT superfamily N-acetyltransferase